MTVTETDVEMDVDYKLEPTCESEHNRTVCSGAVEWSRPASRCGCTSRQLVCQVAYDYIFQPRFDFMRLYCPICGGIRPSYVEREGWYRV